MEPVTRLARTQERLSGAHVKGSMVRAHLQWLRENLGEDGSERTLALLPPALAADLRETLASTWCSLESLILLDRAIATASAKDEVELMLELGRYSAQINLSGVYRAFRRTDIHDFFHRSASLHKQFQDFGVSEYQQVDETHGRMLMRDAAAFSPVFCASAPGYYAEVISLHGGTRVSVTETTCRCAGDDLCTFEMQWR
jgi:predicted hydrocarbon binding protein